MDRVGCGHEGQGAGRRIRGRRNRSVVYEHVGKHTLDVDRKSVFANQLFRDLSFCSDGGGKPNGAKVRGKREERRVKDEYAFKISKVNKSR